MKHKNFKPKTLFIAIFALLIGILFAKSTKSVYSVQCGGSYTSTGLSKCEYDLNLKSFKCTKNGTFYSVCNDAFQTGTCAADKFIDGGCSISPDGQTCSANNIFDGFTTSGCYAISTPAPTPTPTSQPPSGGCTDGFCASHSLAPDGYIDNCGEIGKAEGAGTCDGGRCCKDSGPPPPSCRGEGPVPSKLWCDGKPLKACDGIVCCVGTCSNWNTDDGGLCGIKDCYYPQCGRNFGECPGPPQCSVSFPNLTMNEGETITLSTAATTPASRKITVTYDDAVPTAFYFSSNNTAVATVSPGTDTTSPYETNVLATGGGSATLRITVGVTGNGLYSSCSDTSTVTISPAWWQVRNGDVLSGGNLSSRIPGTCVLPGCNPAFDLKPAPLAGYTMYPGLPIYGGLTIPPSNATYDFSASTTSQGIPAETELWIANSPITTNLSQYTYSYFRKQIPPNIQLWPLDNNQLSTGNLNSGQASRGYVWYETTGGTTIQGNIQVPQDNKYVLLVNGGDLYINGVIDIQYPGRGFFMAIVGKDPVTGAGGNIIIDPSVSTQTPDLEGLFLADGTFRTGTRGSGTADEQFTLRGAIAAHGGIGLQRNLGALNSTSPAELFEYAPELIGAFPREFFRDKIIWQEVAP
ncbi:hypothetical protein HYT59_02445 [Candidatus Woesebacteria bacterium]|nr:hypothetical protein [Candidatus Woesebacteria bacterium]